MNPDLTLETLQATFESLKRVSSHGAEYWSARDLQEALGYAKWQNFRETVVARAMESCTTYGQMLEDHFADASKMVTVGSNAERPIDDVYVSRYACYLIAQNGDPSKDQVAAAQTYFALQTRRAEVADESAVRAAARQRIAASHRILSGVAEDAGVQRKMFGVFHDAGYKGLYGGLGQQQIKQKKGIPEKGPLVDYMSHTELAMNDFRQTQAAERLQRDKTKGQEAAIRVHREVGEAVRKLVKDQQNTMPEDLKPEPPMTLPQAKKKALPETK